MTHDSAVRTVVSLVPEIEKRGAAAVLTEYATREDLPVAQLEKLAQVYNTLRTVSHIDNASADERGATVSLLDVPNLVVGYATGANQEKAAAGPHSFSSHDHRTVDLNRALRRDMGMSKAAAQVTGPAAQANEMLKEAISAELAVSSLLELEIDLQDEMSKLASDIFSAAPRVGDGHFCRDISEFEEEALQYQPASIVKAAGDFMEKFAAPHRTKLVRFGYAHPVKPHAYDIGHRLGQKFAELAKTASTLDVIIKMAARVLAPDVPKPPADTTPRGDMNDLFNVGSFKDEPLEGNPATPDKPEEGEDKPLDEKAEEAKEQGLTTTTDAAPAKGERYKDDRKPTASEDRSQSSGGSVGGGVKGPGREEGGITKDDILSILAAPINAAKDTIHSAAGAADATISGIVGKERQNKSQKAADLSVEDIRRAMAVRRLIGTDPVLREADPKAVLEVYNSVVRRNPDLAGDMASLRLVLREAVSYEGLTLDSQKLLTEIRRNSEQADEAAANNEKRRYAVGGATNPLPLAKS